MSRNGLLQHTFRRNKIIVKNNLSPCTINYVVLLEGRRALGFVRTMFVINFFNVSFFILFFKFISILVIRQWREPYRIRSGLMGRVMGFSFCNLFCKSLVAVATNYN